MRLFLLIALATWICASAQSFGEAPPVIDRLVEQLGSNSFEEREAATKQLQLIGEPALKALEAAASSKDAEIRRRARALLRTIESSRHKPRLFEGHTNEVTSVAFSPGGRHLLSASTDCTLRLWNVEKGSLLRTFTGHTKPVSCVIVSKDGERAISASHDMTLRVWEVQPGKELGCLKGHTDIVNSVVLSPEGKKALSASSDHTLRLWDLTRHIETIRFEMPSGKDRPGTFLTAVFSADGERVVALGGVRHIYVWRSSGSPEAVFFGLKHAQRSVVPVRGMTRFLFGGQDGALTLLDVAPFNEHGTFPLHAGAISHLAISADGRRVLTGSVDRMMRLWDVWTAEERCSFSHGGAVTSVAFSPDGRRAASGSTDKLVRVWPLPK